MGLAWRLPWLSVTGWIALIQSRLCERWGMSRRISVISVPASVLRIIGAG